MSLSRVHHGNAALSATSQTRQSLVYIYPSLPPSFSSSLFSPSFPHTFLLDISTCLHAAFPQARSCFASPASTTHCFATAVTLTSLRLTLLLIFSFDRTRCLASSCLVLTSVWLRPSVGLLRLLPVAVSRFLVGIRLFDPIPFVPLPLVVRFQSHASGLTPTLFQPPPHSRVFRPGRRNAYPSTLTFG